MSSRNKNQIIDLKDYDLKKEACCRPKDDDSCDHYKKKPCFDCERYLRVFAKKFYSTLTVSASVIPGLEPLLDFSNGEWTGAMVELLKAMVSRIPGIYKIRIVAAETVEESRSLVETGQVAFDITPVFINRDTLDTFSYLAISKNNTNSFVVAFTVQGCPENSTTVLLQNFLTTNPSYEQLINFINSSLNMPLVIINNTAFYPPLVTTAPTQVIPTTPQQLLNLIQQIAAFNQTDICDTLYLGPYPTCPAALENLPPGLVISRIVIEPDEFVSEAYGWTMPKYVPNLQLWLQLALDQVISCNGYKKIAKEFSLFPNTCALIPLIAPPPLYSVCQRFIPATMPYEILLPDPECIEPHKVIILNNNDCVDTIL